MEYFPINYTIFFLHGGTCFRTVLLFRRNLIVGAGGSSPRSVQRITPWRSLHQRCTRGYEYEYQPRVQLPLSNYPMTNHGLVAPFRTMMPHYAVLVCLPLNKRPPLAVCYLRTMENAPTIFPSLAPLRRFTMYGGTLIWASLCAVFRLFNSFTPWFNGQLWARRWSYLIITVRRVQWFRGKINWISMAGWKLNVIP